MKAKKTIHFNNDGNDRIIKEIHVYDVVNTMNAAFQMNGDQDSQISLLNAIKEHDYDLIRYIISKIKLFGIVINAHDLEHGRTILHSAIIHNVDITIVELLIRSGASVNTLDHIGRSPLSSAFLNQNVDSTLYLLSNGANLNDITGRMLMMNPGMAINLEHAGFIQPINQTEFLTTPDITHLGSSAEAHNNLNDVNNTPSIAHQSRFYGAVMEEEYPVVVGNTHSSCCCIS